MEIPFLRVTARDHDGELLRDTAAVDMASATVLVQAYSAPGVLPPGTVVSVEEWVTRLWFAEAGWQVVGHYLHGFSGK
jgi:hypothetical protein